MSLKFSWEVIEQQISFAGKRLEENLKEVAKDSKIDKKLSMLSAAQLKKRETRIRLLIIQPCRFEKTKSLFQFQAAHGPNEPLSELSLPAQERVWLKLMDEIQYFMEH